MLEPDLLMDEPFSALDVLTAENPRGELMRLRTGKWFSTKGICLVTHNLEEAVQLADRVLVLGSGPGRLCAEVTVDLSRPRERTSPGFAALVDRLYDLLTGRRGTRPGRGDPDCAAAARRLGRRAGRAGARQGRASGSARAGRGHRLRDRRPAPARGRRSPAVRGRGRTCT
ncbi:hypothetical protein [Amycolatopsis sulphurea]|uniref:hypothetical protein n=1 Tax=Amycolatopsis sulphurea TaxID=76022 RepID=UPI001B80CAE2|nr:hypothetical protein [Amycolatopsis sulphurea]